MDDLTANAALAFRDIHPAPAPGWWPPAPGWWLLGLLGILILFAAGRRLRRYWQRRQLQRVILGELKKISRRYHGGKTADSRAFVAETFILMRRVALRRFPDATVASLSEQQWLRFLDRTGETQYFGQHAEVLAAAPYQPQPQLDTTAFYRVARQWLKKNS